MTVDLSAWSDLYRRAGPVSYVHLDVSRDAEDAATVLDIRWRDLRDRLAQQGSPEQDRTALDEVVTIPVQAGGPVSRYSVAGDGQVLYDQVLSGGRDNGPDLAEYAPMVDLTPVVRHASRRLPYLLVEAGRDGAEISVHEAGRERRHADVDGEDLHLSKVRGGGWSHRRMQQRTEEVWRRNAAEVADTVDEVARRSRTRLVVLAGDVRAREKVRQNLPTAVVDELVEVDRHTRPEGASEDAVDSALEQAIDDLLERERTQVLDRLHAGDTGHAVVGLSDTIDALREARVSVLLLDPQAAAREPATVLASQPWIAPAAAGDRAGDQSGDDVAEPLGELPGQVALLRAGALTGAQVLLVDAEELPGGAAVAGLVRWEQPD